MGKKWKFYGKFIVLFSQIQPSNAYTTYFYQNFFWGEMFQHSKYPHLVISPLRCLLVLQSALQNEKLDENRPQFNRS